MMSGGGLDFTTDDELSGSPAPQALRGNPLARNPLMGATKTPLNASGWTLLKAAAVIVFCLFSRPCVAL